MRGNSKTELIHNGVEYRHILNALERHAEQCGSTKEDRWDWVQCQQGYQNILSDLTKLVGDEQEAVRLINGRLN